MCDKSGGVKDAKKKPDTKLSPKADCKTKKVVEIRAKLPATKSARGTHSTTSASFKDFHEFKSSSSAKQMASNAPAVLIRNCSDIQLEAKTDPPNEAGVVWKVESNPGPNSPAPALTASGAKATLKTNASGGYVISASLGGTTVYWNLVLVEVEITSSQILRNSGNMKDKSSPGRLTVSSGVFDLSQPAKCAMYVKVNVKFTAGKQTSLDSYCDKAHAGIANILLNTTAQANYDGGGKVLERIPSVSGLPNPVVNPATVVVDVGYPILDRGGGAGTRATGGETIFLSRTRSTPANGITRKVESCDSPAVGFPSLLPEHGKAATKKVKSNTGVNAFKIYLVAYSDDAKFSYVVFGHGVWTADYSGTVLVGAPGNTAVWTKDVSCGITGAGAALTKIVGGQEAKAAGCEVHHPVYLTYILDAT